MPLRWISWREARTAWFQLGLSLNAVMPAKAGIPLQLPATVDYASDTMKQPAVYILASRYRGTLYVGVTSSLWSRVHDHKNGTTAGFTSKHGLNTLVWYEHHHTMERAIAREKQIKA